MKLQPEDIRTFIQDRPELNRLLDKEEFSQKQIDLAMKLTVAQYNEMSPATTHSLEDFPYTHILLIGTIWHLFFGGGILRDRNRLPHNAGGVQVDDEAHATTELQFAENLRKEFESLSKQKKVEMNILAGFGTIYSEYVRPTYNRTYIYR